MRHAFSRRGISALVVLTLALVLGTSTPSRVTEAQSGGALAYGSTVAGTLTPEAPLLLYSFQGHIGDHVQIEVLGLSGGLIPLVDLIAPDRQTLATAQRDGLSFSAQDAHIARVLPQDGAYAVMLGGVDGTVGDFLLTLEGHALQTTTPLPFGVPTPVTLAPETPSQLFTFTAESCPTVLTLIDASEGEPFTFRYFAEVHNEDGEEVARWRGGETYEDRVTVEPNSGTYEVTLWSDDPTLTGTLTLIASCADQAPACVGNTAGIAGDDVSRCPTCPPCGPESTCEGFQLLAAISDDGTVTVSWPEVEGATAAIVSSTNESGELTYARLVEGATSETIDYAARGITGGTQTIHVDVGSEELGYALCTGTLTVDITLGPVEWGEGEDDLPEECSITLESPRDIIANGLQTFFWSDVPGADGYELRISNSSDTLIMTTGVPGTSHSVTVDTSDAFIGPGTEFYIRIFALRDDAYWCIDGVIVERH